ncbi:MAG: hypothetical protein Ctma_1418 [Catillopecten margaritatus gill symbiont]|uniref:Uncharacterized protein n=1 Tax=Catillopecten margaritatus gill symbiont TaxID=3083288 RepID=A0AAU6PI80_9GAMM
MNSQDGSLCIFIRNFYENITGITGELRDITVGHPTISEDCNNIIQLSEEAAFIDLNQASFYKKIANIAIHILYVSPLKTAISKTGPLNQYLKVEEFKALRATPNHQNAIVAIFYAIHLLNQEIDNKIEVSCHSLSELVQTLCAINMHDENETNLYQSLISTTKHLALLLEQITYKTNSTLQYQLCPGDL